MEKSNNKFKLILLSVFGFFIVAGLIAFSLFRSNNTGESNLPTISIWGTVDQGRFRSNFISKYDQDKSLELKRTYTEHDISHH